MKLWNLTDLGFPSGITQQQQQRRSKVKVAIARGFTLSAAVPCIYYLMGQGPNPKKTELVDCNKKRYDILV